MPRRSSVTRQRTLIVCLGVIGVVVLLAAWLDGPRAAPAPTARPTTPTNGSLETDSDSNGVPDCWAVRTSGRNAGTATRTTPGRLSRHAEAVQISAYYSGARVLQVSHASRCYLRVTSRHQYRFGVWYHGSGELRFVADFRTSEGVWRRWISSPRLSPASRFTLARFDTAGVPYGATGVVFGLELRSVGDVVTDDYTMQDRGPLTTVRAPPPSGGYFRSLVPPSGWRTLPGDAACAARVHRSTWEPRPHNFGRNHLLPYAPAVHAAFRNRPRHFGGSYSRQWDAWLLPRVDGQFTGTTDEILQWAACKWGLPDNFLRAEADVESTWFQYETYRTGRCVAQYGCGDFFTYESAAPRRVYCAAIAADGGYDYQRDFGIGQCPKTFSILGIMVWWNPQWGYRWAQHQNGAFPYARDETAFAADYMASQLRGCYEGWEYQLGPSYHAGDLWGCAGAWYSGNWRDAAARRYIREVRSSLDRRVWLARDYRDNHGPCLAGQGCPVPG